MQKDRVSSAPFHIHVPDDALSDLHQRLRSARLPQSLDAEGWEDGAGLAFMERLRQHWLERFDWRAQEARLNDLPHRLEEIEGQQLHFVHQEGVGPSPLPLVLTHGWPGSFLEFERLIPLLTDPGAHGGNPADAFHVVAPSLPGYGFSPPPTVEGTGPREIAGLWRGLMQSLGYERFGAQGGDIGAGVSMWLARLYPKSLCGLHLNYVSAGYKPSPEAESTPITEEEQAYLDRAAEWSRAEGAYAALHATKPQTLAFALTDSPLGLAAWIVEKVRAWSDNSGDPLEAVDLDTLLTDICLYWFSESLTASLRLYKEGAREPFHLAPGERVKPPLGVALFPRELPLPPRSWIERGFDLRRWTQMASGGHFAALERPEVLAADIRAFFKPLRRF